MPIVKLQLPDGQIVQVDTGEESSFPERLGKSVVAGFGKAATGLAELPQTLTGLGMRGIYALTNSPTAKAAIENPSLLSPSSVAPALESAGSFYSDLGKEGIKNRFGRAAVEGASGGVLGGIPGVVGGAAGGLAGEATQGFGPMVSTPTSLIASMLAAKQVAPGLSYAEKQIRSAAGRISPQEFAEAMRNRGLLAKTRAQTGTLPELFPGDTQLKRLSNEVVGVDTGRAGVPNALAARVSGRQADLEGLTDRQLRTFGDVNVQNTAVKASDAGNAVLRNMENFRSAGTAAHMAGRDVQKGDVEQIINGLKAMAAVEAQPGRKAAYLELADDFRNTMGSRQYVDTQDLAAVVKNATERAASPDAAAKVKWAAGDMKAATQFAGQALEASAPGYAPAMRFYRDYSQGPYKDAREGITGILAGKSQNFTPEPGSRLGGILRDQRPQEIHQSMAMLTQAGLDPREVLAAVVKQRLGKGTTNPASALFGREGSPDYENLTALMQTAKQGPSALDPSRAATLLQNPPGSSYVRNDLMQSPGAYVAQPFASLKNRFNEAFRAKQYSEMAQILADPRNLEQLQLIAMKDPDMRRNLSLVSGLLTFAGKE